MPIMPVAVAILKQGALRGLPTLSFQMNLFNALIADTKESSDALGTATPSCAAFYYAAF